MGKKKKTTFYICVFVFESACVMWVEKLGKHHHKPISWSISISLPSNFNMAQKFYNWTSH